jgi:hypothetical protein
MTRRTVYHHPTKGTPKLQEKLVKPIKAKIEEITSLAPARWRTYWG